MALSIKDPESDRLARELAQATGETITEAIRTAIRERLQRVKAGTEGSTLADALNEIVDHCAALPVLDDRAADEILDYDEQGLPR